MHELEIYFSYNEQTFFKIDLGKNPMNNPLSLSSQEALTYLVE